MAAGPTQYPIRAVARLTGLSLDTLRAWERRYEAVVPARGERGRVYSAADVARLKRLAALVGDGHAIGQIASLSNAALSRLQKSAAAPRSAADGVVDLEPIRAAVKSYDLLSIEHILNRHAVVLPPRDLIFRVVLPILRDLGERWQAGATLPAQEHLVSSVIRSVLGGLLRTMPRTARARTLVLATLAGERHELGLLCAAVLAAATGMHVVYLGADLPASDIAHATSTTAADILMLAATHSVIDPTELRRLSKVPARVNIWAGGAQATSLRSAIGNRVRQVNSLEEFQALCDTHVS